MSAPEQTIVILLVFSGQQNPSWPLEGEALQGVVERVRAARVKPTQRSIPPPVLGYRGFRIENRAGGELPRGLTVWRGIVVAVRDGKTETWADAGDLEHFLLADARRRGHGDLLSAASAPSEPASHAR
jgi:hypothetical protein